MFIQVDHDTGISCFGAVKSALEQMEPGDHVTITGMAMGHRHIHVEVLRALIYTAREDLGRNFGTQVEPSGNGWSNVLLVVCTGYA